ncbi:type II toxin-antitoxin system RelE family toxin [Niabella ginsengisoli]|uniref:Type II toxin-antitoxin system RelE/ParE family toxin n=1 Tax=Niabella ginsengisoli TaxID=522298 RepID=A0ABS9SK91_9BACT|nr:type II toxin-antitoxin system RelE/ParE family toxin [Niabella ginsengisoli]MCH5598807.1 type II toxin-antitoxin system RelE/ParE family toxin [Niabella ginsengisoli]
MQLVIRPSANKDVKSLPKAIKVEIEKLILQIIEAKNINELSNIKKLKGHPRAYRIKIKDYRIGFFVEDDTIILSRILHRKEVYRYFP